MKVKRQGHRNPIPVEHCNFLIYDDTVAVDETARARASAEKLPMIALPDGVDRDAYLNKLTNTMDDSWKRLMGAAYGHPWLCCFVVYANGRIELELDGEKRYTPEELKTYIRLAKAAKRRCVWKEREDVVAAAGG